MCPPAAQTEKRNPEGKIDVLPYEHDLATLMGKLAVKTFALAGVMCYSPDNSHRKGDNVRYSVKIVGTGISGGQQLVAHLAQNIEQLWKSAGFNIAHPADETFCRMAKLPIRTYHPGSAESIQGVTSDNKYAFHMHLSSAVTEFTLVALPTEKNAEAATEFSPEK